MRLHISSCANGGNGAYAQELARLALFCPPALCELSTDPSNADIILITDISDFDLFASLRRNNVWKRWPRKSFVVYEGDSPPIFLHGLVSSTSRAWARSGRFVAAAYPMHQLSFPNPVPAGMHSKDCPKDLLFSFAGRNSHRIRRNLFALSFPNKDVIVENTSNYNHFSIEATSKDRCHLRYWDLCSRSKYVLCPRGAGTSSMRVFEMLEAGIPPVIIADDWDPSPIVNWSEFSLFLPESRLHNIYEFVKSHEDEFLERGRKARLAYEKYFAPGSYLEYILASVDHIDSTQAIPEAYYTLFHPLLVMHERLSRLSIRAQITAKAFARAIMRLRAASSDSGNLD